jgi:hypothetical protein
MINLRGRNQWTWRLIHRERSTCMLEDEVGSNRPPKRNVVAHLFVTYDWKKQGVSWIARASRSIRCTKLHSSSLEPENLNHSLIYSRVPRFPCLPHVLRWVAVFSQYTISSRVNPRTLRPNMSLELKPRTRSLQQRPSGKWSINILDAKTGKRIKNGIRTL